MALRPPVIGVAYILTLVVGSTLMGQEEPLKGRGSLRLRSRTIATDELSRPLISGVAGTGRVHLLVQTDGSPLNIGRLEERDIRVVGYIPDNGVAISVRADEDLSGLGFRWVGALEAKDRRGFPEASAAQDDTSGYYVVQFYSDVDMGNARTLVLGEQVAIRDNPSLLATQLLVSGSHAQMVKLSSEDTVVYIFPASDELIQGTPTTACVSGNTAYGLVLPIASSLSGGWSSNGDGVAALTYSFGPLTSKIPADTLKQLFVQAQQQWGSLVKLSFTETASRTATRNVDLGFYSGDHGDQFPFDGPGGVLAHTFYPAPPNSEPVAGDMHMDADEAWGVSGSGTDFYSVALHELGHALGLGHTTGPLDVMYPFYRRNTTFSQTDINAIQALYQAHTATPPSSAPLGLTVQPVGAQVTTATIGLTGSTSGGQGTIRVSWTTDRGGLGTAQGSSNWTVSAMPLAVGRNTITVRAQDDTSAAVSQTVIVERIDSNPTPPSSPQAPTIQITSPSDGSLTTTALTADVKGTATHPAGIKSISWRASTGASGVAQGTTAWDTGFVGLQVGVNTVTVDAISLDGGTASKTVQITVNTVPTLPPGGGGADTTNPTMEITSPSTTSVYTSDSSIVIKGTASDNVGVSVVRWETPVSGGVAAGTANWNTGPIPLFVGMNNITIRAYDAAGNSSWRSITVTRR